MSWSGFQKYALLSMLIVAGLGLSSTGRERIVIGALDTEDFFVEGDLENDLHKELRLICDTKNISFPLGLIWSDESERLISVASNINGSEKFITIDRIENCSDEKLSAIEEVVLSLLKTHADEACRLRAAKFDESINRYQQLISRQFSGGYVQERLDVLGLTKEELGGVRSKLISRGFRFDNSFIEARIYEVLFDRALPRWCTSRGGIDGAKVKLQIESYHDVYQFITFYMLFGFFASLAILAFINGWIIRKNAD